MATLLPDYPASDSDSEPDQASTTAGPAQTGRVTVAPKVLVAAQSDAPQTPLPSTSTTLMLPLVSSAPSVLPQVCIADRLNNNIAMLNFSFHQQGDGDLYIVDPSQKEVFYNPRIQELYRPQVCQE
jgi:hypothetical protein